MNAIFGVILGYALYQFSRCIYYLVKIKQDKKNFRKNIDAISLEIHQRWQKLGYE
jgi:low temperature requirement protein LtrA